MLFRSFLSVFLFTYPGGCEIGSRPIDLHLKAFEKLGIHINQNYGNITCSTEKIIGSKIDFDFPSVGATENAILASVLAEGKTIITNAAREPEIIDLQNFLNKMGAKIKGAGTNEIEIEGVKKLKEISYNVMPDGIEAGTFLCLAAITGGKIKLEKVNSNHLTPVIAKLEEAGCEIKIQKEIIEIISPKKLKAIDIKTMPYPGFPTIAPTNITDERILCINSSGISYLLIFVVFIITLFFFFCTFPPSNFIISYIICVSCIFGTLYKVVIPLFNIVAAIIGSEAFFEPEIFTIPSNLLPPFII